MVIIINEEDFPANVTKLWILSQAVRDEVEENGNAVLQVPLNRVLDCITPFSNEFGYSNMNIEWWEHQVFIWYFNIYIKWQ